MKSLSKNNPIKYSFVLENAMGNQKLMNKTRASFLTTSFKFIKDVCGIR